MIRFGIRDGGTPAGVMAVDQDGVRVESWRLKDRSVPEALDQFDDLEQIEGWKRAENRMGKGIAEPEQWVPADQQEVVRAVTAFLHQRGFNLVRDQ